MAEDASPPQRVFVGTHEIARQVHDMAAGFRLLGHSVTTVLGEHNPLFRDLDYDHVVYLDPPVRPTGEERAGPPTLARRAVVALSRKPIPAWIRKHDVFVFVWGASLLPGNRDLPVLRRLGKTVLSVFLGSDIRHWSAAEQFRAGVGFGTYDGYKAGRSLDRAVRTLRMAELYADASFLQPSYAELAVAPYFHFFLAVDLSLYRFQAPTREEPVVVHAPSRRSIKGTAEILEAADRLRREGTRFELRLLENVPNAEVARHLADADVVVDELNESHYGMLALEAMASGCAVLGGNRPDIVPLPPDPPVVHVTPGTILDELRSILTRPERRAALAAAGRRFVERHHDHVAVARSMLATPARARRGDHDYHPSWFAERYVLPPGTSLGTRNRALTAHVARRSGADAAVLEDLGGRGLA